MLILGIALGVLVTGLGVLYLMRNHMISRVEVKGGFEKVCAALEQAIEAVEGWGQPFACWDLYRSQVVKNLNYDNIRALKVFFVCKPIHANRILRKFPHMAAMMPCSWTVYEQTDGKVFLAKMNLDLMRKVFLGNVVGTVMGQVAREEKEILAEMYKRLEAQPADTEKAQA